MFRSLGFVCVHFILSCKCFPVYKQLKNEIYWLRMCITLIENLRIWDLSISWNCINFNRVIALNLYLVSTNSMTNVVSALSLYLRYLLKFHWKFGLTMVILLLLMMRNLTMLLFDWLVINLPFSVELLAMNYLKIVLLYWLTGY